MLEKIFISFRESDRQHREGFEGLLQNPNSSLKAIPISSREDVRHQGELAVKNYIKEMLDESDIMICLIGDDSHNSKWIDYEVDVAISKNIPIIGVRVPNTYGSGPILFKKRDLPLINWNVNEIKREINKHV